MKIKWLLIVTALLTFSSVASANTLDFTVNSVGTGPGGGTELWMFSLQQYPNPSTPGYVPESGNYGFILYDTLVVGNGQLPD